MTDGEREAAKAAFKLAEKRWRKFFMDNPGRRYLLEQATEMPDSYGAPGIRVVERTSDDDAEMVVVVEHQPASRFGETGLLHLYATLLPFTQERMGKVLALCWAADDELETDDELEHDDTMPPWWYDRAVQTIQQTERVQRGLQ